VSGKAGFGLGVLCTIAALVALAIFSLRDEKAAPVP